jgi:hypothetical protein
VNEEDIQPKMQAFRRFQIHSARAWQQTKHVAYRWRDGIYEEMFFGPTERGGPIGMGFGAAAGAFGATTIIKRRDPSQTTAFIVLGATAGLFLGFFPCTLGPLYLAAAIAMAAKLA